AIHAERFGSATSRGSRSQAAVRMMPAPPNGTRRCVNFTARVRLPSLSTLLKVAPVRATVDGSGRSTVKSAPNPTGGAAGGPFVTPSGVITKLVAPVFLRCPMFQNSILILRSGQLGTEDRKSTRLNP